MDGTSAWQHRRDLSEANPAELHDPEFTVSYDREVIGLIRNAYADMDAQKRKVRLTRIAAFF
jgi:hypothetical protein